MGFGSYSTQILGAKLEEEQVKSGSVKECGVQIIYKVLHVKRPFTLGER